MKRAKQKRMAVINDFTGFGRCSLAVSLPIISALGIECCALPTAILSNHTGYEHYYFDDYTDKMSAYGEEWKRLGLHFDGICTGFLGSHRQVDIVSGLIDRLADQDTVLVVDPVMGDDGKTYATLTRELCREIGKLAAHADILTPNLTEACLLAGVPYDSSISDERALSAIGAKLHKGGSRNIVITGISCGKELGNFIFRENGTYILQTHPKTGGSRAGTGDVFSSMIAADALNGLPLEQSVERTAALIAEAVTLSDEMEIPPEEGVCFELLLGKLIDSSKNEH